MCLYPKLIKNKKYTETKKNEGIVPIPKDARTLYIPIGCQKCMECKKQKAREWRVRLGEEIKTNKKAEFVTLTFSNEEYQKLAIEAWVKKDVTGYELDNEIATIATRRFLERWRTKNKKSVKHWLVTELGHEGTENIHIHGLIWTNKKDEIIKQWKYGFVYIGEWVNEQTVNYITKYVFKVDKEHKEYNAKILTSPGIGAEYTKTINAQKNKYKKGETKEYYTTRTGIRQSLPIYYRNKLYTDDEKEKLWIEKLDKKERWVNGSRIDVSKKKNDYTAALKEAQKLNKKLGYGDDKKNWEQKEYEQQRRMMMQDKRGVKDIW